MRFVHIGIAAQSRAVVDAVLAIWLSGAVDDGDGGFTRRVDAVHREDHPLTAPEPGVDYWNGPCDDDDEPKPEPEPEAGPGPAPA